MNVRLGVDTGGTFTDFVWVGADGRVQIHKQLSTPHDPSAAILQGIDVLHVPEGTAVVHGSTVATNALLERRGARTALITTKGFADVLEIGRQNRPDIYALVPQKPPPLVPRYWRFELDERITAQGDVLRPLNPDGLRPILAKLAEEQIESVAVCLVFSFLYPGHERQIQHTISQYLPIPISLSADILPEYREYERTSTTVINAYVAPLMSRYLGRLADGLGARPLTIMQSNGGVISAATAGQQAARTALSGPAGGVVGAHYVAAQAGFSDLITFDMGGTSTDVALCHGRIPTTTSGHIAGMPLCLPLLDIHTVGAGGGSLAYVDAGGALHVGPQSAGADPGPACYGKEIGDWRLAIKDGLQSPISNLQSRATVTDANLVLGRLDADHFLGGAMRLDVAAARAALSELASMMGTDSVEAAAWGVIQVANANMERAIRHISVERGYDPRLFTLLPFGGAGPLHAAELAANLHIPRVFIPPSPGVLSALGMLVAAPTKDYSRTVMAAVAGGIGILGDKGLEIGDWLGAQFAGLEERARSEMAAEGHHDVTLHYALDMRYKGQSHELTIPIDRPSITDHRLPITALFHTAHQTRYGYHQPEVAVEIVTIRLTAVASVTPPPLPQYPLGEPDATAAWVGEKEVWFNQQLVVTRLYDRAGLRPGHQFPGPAILFQYDTTIVVPPEWGTAVDRYGNLLLTKT
ncbi:MAG: hydantoinase/oxoprolinase family protein [Chloroflexi bacterium]|nr:hydantoinase/oxoprolinase family protein [Ardenticatenaceae bacterium]MBL1127402.1 hydantoinase/oxoprolinase family protein [Chloroflexota bacterium]NOG33464.1 hydantoinase/oxoprolinase family protein [Chloroflexota bacterium]GIK58525.1 MAG: 5-oxoprolinase [Chloroflexota bacterium]